MESVLGGIRFRCNWMRACVAPLGVVLCGKPKCKSSSPSATNSGLLFSLHCIRASELSNQSPVLVMGVFKFLPQPPVKRIVCRLGRMARYIRQQSFVSGIHPLPGSFDLFSRGHNDLSRAHRFQARFLAKGLCLHNEVHVFFGRCFRPCCEPPMKVRIRDPALDVSHEVFMCFVHLLLSCLDFF